MSNINNYFNVEHNSLGHYLYYITSKGHPLHGDNNIANHLKIPYIQYVKELEKFGAKLAYCNYYFKSSKKAKQCCDYLNEKYVVLIKLEGV